ncbi:spore germination protein GerPC [Tumebacillus lipolyticus]|uniref:Spore germination protein GerPC n=1 Tax=Tumebacillus lipolyticus TaxID=1280370 RepID=A0ABW4ZU18_9BACL
MHPLLQENDYLRRRVAELERENLHIRLMLAAKTLVIDKVEFNFDKIRIDNLNGALQIGLSHQAEAINAPAIDLPHLQRGSALRI